MVHLKKLLNGVDPQEAANYLVNKKPELNLLKVIEEIKSKKSGIIADPGQLEELAKEVIEENPNLVETYKKGKTTVIMAMVGAVMRKTSGKANAAKAREILEKLLI